MLISCVKHQIHVRALGQPCQLDEQLPFACAAAKTVRLLGEGWYSVLLPPVAKKLLELPPYGLRRTRPPKDFTVSVLQAGYLLPGHEPGLASIVCAYVRAYPTRMIS